MSVSTDIDDFNVIQFEKRLTQLKDSQDAINICCKWCLEKKENHKKIVTCWLNVLKRVKIEQRLTLFYLANDVIQYSKRKNYDFVDSWGTALQKATTLVRDEKVKHKIVRIFNIWQQRAIYNEEFISDLCGLISVIPAASKNDEPHEFQANYVVNKIKHCSKLEAETDTKLKGLKEHNPKIQLEFETLCTSLKDRAHVDDVEKELETYVQHLEGYINALKAEIKCRINNISVLKQANVHLNKDKHDVKVVANAYKVFGTRMKTFQKKLEEHKSTTLSQVSPVPSPDVNAPSPSPDSPELNLPDDDLNTKINQFTRNSLQNYYNPKNNDFFSNAFTTTYTNTETERIPQYDSQQKPYTSFQSNAEMAPPLLPPPLPLFGATNQNNDEQNWALNTLVLDEYNPEQAPENWDTDVSWISSQLSHNLDDDTPQSPPNYEKRATFENNNDESIKGDVDHRLLNVPQLEDVRGRKDVDHRNLISLTGSPAELNQTTKTTTNDSNHLWNEQCDQDYRITNSSINNNTSAVDKDYRLPPINLEQLTLPPPPPPPPLPLQSPLLSSLSTTSSLSIPTPTTTQSRALKTNDKNIDNIDMDLSEEECNNATDNQRHSKSVFPPLPPPFPDDIDANSFLDNLSNDLNSNDFALSLMGNGSQKLQQKDGGWSTNLPPPPLPPPPPPSQQQQQHQQYWAENTQQPQQQQHDQNWFENNPNWNNDDMQHRQNNWPRQPPPPLLLPHNNHHNLGLPPLPPPPLPPPHHSQHHGPPPSLTLNNNNGFRGHFRGHNMNRGGPNGGGGRFMNGGGLGGNFGSVNNWRGNSNGNKRGMGGAGRRPSRNMKRGRGGGGMLF